jgi:NitT/TauT family transport system ATP-binding protein
MNTPKVKKDAGPPDPKPFWSRAKNLLFTPAESPETAGQQEGKTTKAAEENTADEPVQKTHSHGSQEKTPEAGAKVSVEEPVKTGAPSARSTDLPIVVKFANVTKSFGRGASAQVALKDVSFSVEDLPNTGELISIVGPSGCGKSTLLRMIAGLEPHYPQTEGVIEVLGKSENLLPNWERGLVDQKYSLFPHLTVRGNIMFGLDIRGESRSTRGDKADIWIKKVGLEGNEDKYPQELSGGMQQRVAIASTLVLGPRILLMDEPFGALDPKTRLRMQELVVQLWNEQQSTVFIVTHSVEEALYLGDRVFRMGARPGRLLEILKAPRPDLPPEEMRQKKWFIDMARDLLNRLEQDKLATGELNSYSDFVQEHNSRHPTAPR